MPIPPFPTRTDGSFGRDKNDVAPADNLNTQAVAGEYDNIANWLIAVINEIGDTDGSDPGTLWDAIVNSAPGSGDVTAAAVIADDALVRGDGGAKGVQGSPVTLTNGGDLSGINDLTAGNDITAQGDLIAENIIRSAGVAQLNGGAAIDGGDVTINDADIVFTGAEGGLVDGVDVSAHVGGNQHIDWSTTGAEQIHADRYTSGTGALVYIQATEPPGMVDGDFWIDTSP